MKIIKNKKKLIRINSFNSPLHKYQIIIILLLFYLIIFQFYCLISYFKEFYFIIIINSLIVCLILITGSYTMLINPIDSILLKDIDSNKNKMNLSENKKNLMNNLSENEILSSDNDIYRYICESYV